MMSFTETLHGWEWIGMLLARLAVGLLFALSGGGKLFVPSHREQMVATLREAGIPAPASNAVLISSVELVCGSLLVIGLMTRVSCVMLIGVMLGALATFVLPRVHVKNPIAWLSAVLYLPEVLYLVLLVWLFLSGPGRASVDHLIQSSTQ